MKNILSVSFALAMMMASGLGVISASAEAEEYKYVTETYTAENTIVGEPTVVSRLQNADMLEDLEGVVPANLIMTLDANGNVIGTDGKEIGAFVDVFKTNVNSFVIPVVEINDQDAANSFVDIWSNQTKIFDMAVMSADATLLKSVREQIPQIRGIYDCSDKTFADKAAYYEAVKTANLSMANVVVLSQEQATMDAVEYFQYRFKTVWTEMSETSAFDIKSVVSTGTYGIISDDYKAVYRAFGDYKEGSIARASANIAHRGLPSTMTENTLEGALGAYEGGATHIEIDGHLSKDGHVVIMHDGTIDRTTNGSGAVANMTLEQIKQYKVVQKMGNTVLREDPIPTADEIFAEFKDKDVIIVFEIKTGDMNILPALRELIEKHNFWDKIVFISFNNTIIAKSQEVLPEVPTASLGSFMQSDFADNMSKYNAMNTVADASIGDLAKDPIYYDVMMKDRGYMSFGWTYGYASDCVAAMTSGIFGLTNNSADFFGDTIKKVYGASDLVMKKDLIAVDAEISVKAETYKGEVSDVNAEIFAVRDCGTYAEVIVAYGDADCTRYSEAFTIAYEQEKALGLNCLSSVGAGSVLCSILLGAAVALEKKKN